MRIKIVMFLELKRARKILIGISCCVALTGLLVIIGWFTGTDFLVRIHPELTSMKFITAVLFLVCGFQLLFLVKIFIDFDTHYYKHLIILSTVALCSILLCSAILMSPSIGHILDLFPLEKKYDVLTRIPYMPSLLALVVLFIVFSLKLTLICCYDRVRLVLPHIAIGLIIVGTVAFLGNILRINTLFFSAIYGGGVAIHTTVLFILIGIYYFIFAKILKADMHSISKHSQK